MCEGGCGPSGDEGEGSGEGFAQEEERSEEGWEGGREQEHAGLNGSRTSHPVAHAVVWWCAPLLWVSSCSTHDLASNRFH